MVVEKAVRRGSYGDRVGALVASVPVELRTRVRVVHERGVRKVDRIRVYRHTTETPNRDGGSSETQ